MHLALGEAGYLAADFKDESDGGFSSATPAHLGISRSAGRTRRGSTGARPRWSLAPCEQFGSPELQDEVLPRVLSGRFRLCLGYTEPEGGSDVATCKTRAVRDGDGWVINGSKMFTSNTQNAHYVYLITNTDPIAEAQEPDHVSVPAELGLASRSSVPHHGRRSDQYHLLQRRARRRQVPRG